MVTNSPITIAKSSESSEALANRTAARWIAPGVVALLTCLTFIAALSNHFVDWDDYLNLVNNTAFRGLGWNQLRWMFTTFHMGHYQPLSWVTLAIDYLLWGMNPAGYHLTNLLFHGANAVFFYFIGRRLLSKAFAADQAERAWQLDLSAAFAALLFAVHPLRVESVVWATERRDVLSGFFFFWTIYCYLRAASSWEARSRRRWLFGTLTVYGLSLLSKASAVTLPAALLILDVFPLGRLRRGPINWFKPQFRSVLAEKLPFVFLALIFASLAFFAQYSTGAVVGYTVAAKTMHAFYGVMFYLWKSVLPIHLSPIYELPYHVGQWLAIYGAAGIAVVGISLAAYFLKRRWPALLAGWVYYLVTLAPVSGIAQSGPQLVADRYSYLACLSWPLLLAGALYHGWRRFNASEQQRKRIPAVVFVAPAILIIFVLGWLAWKQTGVWRTTTTLWEHAVTVVDSAIAESSLGEIREAEGQTDQALVLYRRASDLNPLYVRAHLNLARLLAQGGQQDEAIATYRRVLAVDPEQAKAHFGLGTLLGMRGAVEEATEHLKEVVKSEPENADGHSNLGNVLLMRGEANDAIEHYRKALVINPTLDDTRFNLGSSLLRLKEFDAAAEQFQLLLKRRPDFAEGHFLLGNALAADQRLSEAIGEFRETVRLKPNFADGHEALARSLAMAGQIDEATQHYQRALVLLKSQREPAQK